MRKKTEVHATSVLLDLQWLYVNFGMCNYRFHQAEYEMYSLVLKTSYSALFAADKLCYIFMLWNNFS